MANRRVIGRIPLGLRARCHGFQRAHNHARDIALSLTGLALSAGLAGLLILLTTYQPPVAGAAARPVQPLAVTSAVAEFEWPVLPAESLAVTTPSPTLSAVVVDHLMEWAATVTPEPSRLIATADAEPSQRAVVVAETPETTTRVTVESPGSTPAAVVPAIPADFYLPAVSSAGPSELERQLFDAINADRAAAGDALLVYDAGLTMVARTRSRQMADQNYFAHTDPFGYSMYTALLAHFGFVSYAWAGENLALNSYPAPEAANRAELSLMKSPTHRANNLSRDFSRLGVGEVTTTDGRHIFVMIFLG